MGERVREPANGVYSSGMSAPITVKAEPLLGAARDWAIDFAVAPGWASSWA
jgi:hypothetical protein